MRPLVVDASTAIAYLRGESTASQVERTLEAHREFRVPGLFWSEVINVLARRHRWPGSQVLAAVYDLEQLGLQSEPPSRAAVLAVIDAVETYGLSAYDAEYLVLAEATDALLLTSDRRLAEVAGSRAIFIDGDHRASEDPITYEPAPQPRAPDWPTWQGSASHWQDLRREALDDMARLAPGLTPGRYGSRTEIP